MTTVKEHYDHHLGSIYSWMIGDFSERQIEQETLFKNLELFPTQTKNAIDLGAGNGIQSISLAKLGYTVLAIDFNDQLLSELKTNKGSYPIKIKKDDLKNIKQHASIHPELIICCGDTIAHLDSELAIKTLLADVFDMLPHKGKLLLSFRDYSVELKGEQRFIPVRSDLNRILTCFLEYQEKTVTVTDILHEKKKDSWILKTSAYQKIRISKTLITKLLEETGFTINKTVEHNRMLSIVAEKA